MRKFLLILIIISISHGGKAQSPIVFCPPGAEWHYSFASFLPYTVYNEKIQYVRDSLLGNVTVKVLSHGTFYINYGPGTTTYLTLIRQNGDTVFFSSRITQYSWQILYNFATPAGQSWTTTLNDSIYDYMSGNIIPSTQTYTVTVDSIKTVTINGFNLRRLYVGYLPDNNNAQITERFGSDLFMFSYASMEFVSDPDSFDRFLCYQDNQFGSIQFTDKPCNYRDYVGLEEIKNSRGTSLYPNPAGDRVTLDFEVNEPLGAEFTLTNALGQILLFNNKLNPHQEIDLSPFKNGIYFISINSQQGQKAFKLIKE